METGNYITPGEIIFFAAGMSGDQNQKVLTNGFFKALIQRSWEELNMQSSFKTGRADFDMPHHLSIPLPADCFDVKDVYVYSGDACVIADSHKVYWKRNYYTKGNGYLANDKGNNSRDPFTRSHSSVPQNKALIRHGNPGNINKLLFYNLENGFLMLSSSCLSAGNKIHIHYGSTGCKVEDAPIIPVYFKTAIEDYVTEAALRFRMANEPAMIRTWSPMQQLYERRLDKDGMNGSWFQAVRRASQLNKSQRSELYSYLGRASWAQGR